MENILFLIHFASTLYLLGLIFVIQFVHYPSFIYVSEKDFSHFEKFHTSKMGLIVAPIMLLELFTALFLILFFDTSLLFLLLSLMILIIWLTTISLSVPCHHQLLQGKDLAVIKKLIKTNWPRTLLWTIRSLGLSYILYLKYL